ncbi:MAG: DUF3943 domain-containing protein [marine benthic group bacterium]|nr:DUF3943 domain-containing protein [Gemmatimonadota bacterium]
MRDFRGPAAAGLTVRTAWSLLALLVACVTSGTAQEMPNPTNAERLQPPVPAAVSPPAPQTRVSETASEEDLTAEPSGAQDEEEELGPWGERRSLGAAVGEVTFINILVWSYNEYIRGADFTQVNPRSWWNNLEGGFTYDDNNFNTNMFAHPFHGSLYYNAGRSNGFNYWESLGFSLFGSLMWECCGETHPPAWNDWIATGVGGAAVGEMLYRVSGTVLDNTATGSERTWREIGAFALSPVRGFNRLVSGRSGRVMENPEEPEDHIPGVLSNRLSAGVRIIGEGESLSDSSETHGLFQVDFKFGDEFAQQRRKPFDVFDMSVQLNLGDKQTLGRLSVRGNLFTWDLKKGGDTQHVFAIEQEFQYMNNNAFEFGGQMFDASLHSRFGLSNDWSIRTQVNAIFALLSAVNSEWAFLANDIPNRERFREYDFGPGVGGRIGANLSHKGRQVLSAFYWYQWIDTQNGSNLNGSDAYHNVQLIGARGMVPIGSNFGIGADAYLFLRDSHFELFEDQSQRVPQLRIYGVWDTALVGGGRR